MHCSISHLFEVVNFTYTDHLSIVQKLLHQITLARLGLRTTSIIDYSTRVKWDTQTEWTASNKIRVTARLHIKNAKLMTNLSQNCCISAMSVLTYNLVPYLIFWTLRGYLSGKISVNMINNIDIYWPKGINL